MGKPKSRIRRFFNLVKMKTKKNLTKYECPYCEWRSIPNVTRMRGHLLDSCSKVPEEVREEVKSTATKKITTHFKRTERSKNQSIVETEDEDLVSDDDDVPMADEESRMKQKITPPITNFISKDTMSQKEQEHLSDLFGRAVYATGTSFRKFEHPDWQKFFQEVRPTFKVPSRDHLGNKILDKEYQKLSAEMAQQLATAESLSIGLDGWSNLRRESIVNILLFTPTPLFLESIDCGSDRHFATFYAEKAAKVIEEKGSERFTAYITDNAKNMKASGKIIEAKYQHICWYGCLMHALNLLLSDFNQRVNLVKHVFQTCVNITNEIRDKGLILPIFKEKQTLEYGSKKVSLKPIGKTRFGSHYTCAEAILKNKSALRSLCVDARIDKKIGNNAAPTIDAEIKREILSEDFWTLLSAILKFLEPVYAWLYKVQTDRCLISQVVICFKQIMDSATHACNTLGVFDDDDSTIIWEIINERRDFAVRDIHFAANLLDPFVNSDEYMSSAEKERALIYIDKVAKNLSYINESKVAQEFILFSAKEGHFSPQHLWRAQDVAALSWWKAFAKNTELGKIAIRVLSPPVCAAAIERSFSTQGRIHSKERNRLGTVKSGRLTYLYENYRYMEKGQRPEKKKQKSDDSSASESDEWHSDSGSADSYELGELIQNETESTLPRNKAPKSSVLVLEAASLPSRSGH